MLSSTDAERFTDLVLTDEINQLEILVSFRKDNRTNKVLNGTRP
jgi:vesicle coat complex subunit